MTDEEVDGPRVPVQVTRGCVVAGIQVDLSPGLLTRLQTDVLARVSASGARGVVIGLEGVELLDSDDWGALRRLARKAKLLGARTVLVGLRPEVVSALVDLDVDLDGIDGARDLDSALRLLGVSP